MVGVGPCRRHRLVVAVVAPVALVVLVVFCWWPKSSEHRRRLVACLGLRVEALAVVACWKVVAEATVEEMVE